ncbi:MAG: HPr kinase/phosphatase C-terminal domain-containing protein [Emcibacter sp.]|nr:HPr kinase/phosphatase C-terminal domain-containing protein [Emcibacter sp.]
MTLTHATGILFEGKGVLIMGPSGSGKSDLALRLMAQGAELIGDDYVEVSRQKDGRLIMTVPATIAGKMEVRNVGILEVAFRPTAEIDLALCLVTEDEAYQLERLPEQKFITLEGGDIPCLDFYGLEGSAPEKLWAALKILT